MSKVKSRVGATMKAKGITYAALQRVSGLSPQTIARACDDSRISTCTLGVLETIAAALGVKVRDLFDEQDD